MKKILITLAIAMTSVAAAMAADWLPGLDKHPNVVCRCHPAKPKKGCYVNNVGDTCASGTNIQCQKYVGNCR